MRKWIAVCMVGILIVVVTVRWYHSSILFEYQLSSSYRLTIRQVSSTAPLRITYHTPPALGMHMVAEQEVMAAGEAVTFTPLVDAKTGVVCVFDNHELGFLLMYNPENEDLWDSSGRVGGWHGSDRSEWQSLLTELRLRNPTIPYAKLPGGS